MPKITKPKGMATINSGFITPSFIIQALQSLWIFGRGRGVKTGKLFGVEPTPKFMPLWS